MTTTNNKEFIPTVDGKYIPRKVDGINDVEVFTRAYKHKMNILLVGETGTGKTHAVRDFCHKNKLPYFPLNLTESTQVEDLVGQMIPDEKGGFKWVDGPLTRFIRYGGVIVVEEINAANAGVLFVLHSILDDQRRLCITQKDGEVVTAHEDFWFVASLPKNEPVLMNDGLVKIGDVVENNFKKYESELKTIGDNTVLNTQEKEIFCYAYDPQQKKNVVKKITALIKHKPTDFIYQIKTKNNRTCQLTGTHSVFKTVGQPVKVSELKKGDKIIAPSRLDNSNKGNGILDLELIRDNYPEKPILLNKQKIWWHRSPYKMNRYINLDNPELAWLLGFWIAEGSFCSTINNKSAKLDIVSWSNKKYSRIQRIRKILKDVFGTESYTVKDKRTGVYNIVCGSKCLAYFFRHFKITTHAKEKEIPSFVFSAKQNFIDSFIEGMWEGDGTKHTVKRKGRKDRIEQSYTTISKKLANQLSYLLLFKGIQTAIYTHKPSKHSKDGCCRQKTYQIRIGKTTTETLLPIEIIDIKKIKTTKQYVYDFEVMNDHKNDNFIGGFGAFLLHNTMNPDYEGTKPLNAALKDRFHVSLYYDYDEVIEKQLVKSDEIRKLAAKLRPLYKKGELLTPVSTRGLMQFEKNIEVFGHDAAVESFLNRFNRDEAQSIRGAMELIFTRKTKNALVEEANEKVGR